MNIIVLVKQVPDTSELKMKAGAELTEGVLEDLPLKINTFDRYVIEEAARIKDMYSDSKVNAICLGDENSERVLIEALSIVADAGYRVLPETYGGGDFDSLKKAAYICDAINSIEEKTGRTDIILLGRQSTDSSSSQLGCMISEILGITGISSAVEVKSVVKNKNNAEDKAEYSLKVITRNSEGFEEKNTNTPVLITMTKPDHDVRFPTFKRIRWANREPVTVIKESKKASEMTGCVPDVEIVGIKKPGRNSKSAVIRVSDYKDAEEHNKSENGSDFRSAGEMAADELIRMLEEDKILKI